MHPIRIDRLSAAQHAELDHANRTAKDGRLRIRALIVLLAAERGMVAADIAAVVRMHEETVRRWLVRYHAEGLAGPQDSPRSGAPPKVTRTYREQLLAVPLVSAEQPPHLLPIAPARGESGAVCQRQLVLAVATWFQPANPVDPHHVRPMHPHELRRVEPRFEDVQRFSHEVVSPPGDDRDVVALRLYTVDVRGGHEVHPLGVADHESLRIPALRPGPTSCVGGGATSGVAGRRGGVATEGLQRDAERSIGRRDRAGVGGSGRCPERLEQPPHRPVEAVDVDRLDEVVDRVEIEGPDRVLLARGDEDDARGALQRPRRLPGEGLDRGDAIEAGHADVEEQHVGGSVAERGENGRTAPAFRRELELGVPREQRTQAGAGEGLVIGDQHLPRAPILGGERLTPSARRSAHGRGPALGCGPSTNGTVTSARVPPPGGRSSTSEARAP